MSKNIVLENVVLSYPHLFEPSAYQAGDTPRYSATFIITDPAFDWGPVQAALDEATREGHPNGLPAGARTPISHVKDGPYMGLYQIKASAKIEYPPEVVDQNVNRLLDRSQIFAGCIVNASLSSFSYQGGISFAINHVQLVDNQNVTRLDAGKSATEVFQPVAGAPAPLTSPQQAPMQQPNMGAPVQQPLNAPPMGAPVQQPQQMPAQAQPMGAPVQQTPQQAQAPVQPGAPVQQQYTQPAKQPWEQ